MTISVPTQLSERVSVLTSSLPSGPLAFLPPSPAPPALGPYPPRLSGPLRVSQSRQDEGTQDNYIPMRTSWEKEGFRHRNSPLQNPSGPPWRGVEKGARSGVGRLQVSGWGRSLRPEREGGAGRGSPGGIGAWERARRRGARGGGRDSGGAAEAGRAAPPQAEGAEPRSQLPPGRRAQADDTARGRARTARTLSPNNAPRRSAGRRAARRPAARPGERGPEVSPRRLLQSLPLFVWQTWAQREAPGERGGYRAGDPSRRPPE